LARALEARGDVVWVVTRQKPTHPRQLHWDPARGLSSPASLEGLDGLFNLAGEPLATRPWTSRRRAALISSRVLATQTLLADLAQRQHHPRVYIGAGHLGFYGDGGDELLTEEAPRGRGFLADLAADWEAAHDRASLLGCRVAVLRMGLVLSPEGGALPLLVKPFRVVGGWAGNGQQWTPWISIRDVVGSLLHLADQDLCQGAFNGTAPRPVRNREWCLGLGRALQRPVVTHAPKWALRGALGDLAEDLLLASVRAVPQKLLASGYTFVDPDPDETFRWMVGALAPVDLPTP
jgi:hypothetical protein